jgi:tricorn protease
MLQTPDILGDLVTFASEGDIWVGSIQAGRAHRLTSDLAEKSNPRFSPDGKWIAFTGGYDGGQDVYLIPIDGGTPKRLTYDPYGVAVEGWTRDSQRVLFRSKRENPAFRHRLYTVGIEGGLPKALPMEKAAQGSYSPDGSKLAFARLALESHHWKRYHGGEANAIWIIDLAHGGYKRIDATDVNEQYPAWARDGLYYVSEVEGSANLWKYDPSSGARKRLTNHQGLDVRSVATDGKRVVYAWGYELFVYDPATQKEQRIDFSLPSDHIHARATTVPLAVSGFDLGPTGKRVLLESRGQLFSIGAEKGEARAIAPKLGSDSHGVTWSPDGARLAFISDRSGEENVWLVDSTPGAKPTQLTTFEGMRLDTLTWTPDSKGLVFEDVAQRLWLVDVATKKLTKVAENDQSGFSGFSISPDSAWIAYSASVNLVVRSIYFYNVAKGTTTRVTDAPTADTEPDFDPSGKYLYFLSQRNIEPQNDEIDFQMDLQDTSKVYLVTLAKDTPAPSALKAEEEPVKKPAASGKGAASGASTGGDDGDDGEDAKAAPGPTKVDLAGIGSRIVELGAPGGKYSGLQARKGGVLFLSHGEDGTQLMSLSNSDKEPTVIASEVAGFKISSDNSKTIVQTLFGLQVGNTGEPIRPGSGRVDTSSITVPVEPALEWKEIFEQAWRNERDLFYDPGLHGMPWKSVHDRYAAWLPAVGSRSELNVLIGEMIGEMNVSHSFVGGGFESVRPMPKPRIGSLGADLAWDGTVFRIKHLLPGDGFSFADRSPLLEPGLGVHEGDALLSIDGEPLRGDQDPNALLIGKGGKEIVLSVGPTADASKAKTVRVKAMLSDVDARYYDWVAARRAFVDKAGAGKLGYVHLPDMESSGIRELTKWLYANLDKDGLVIDVRYNHGGIVSGQVLERLTRVIFEFDQGRYGAPQPYHRFGYSGRLVVLCNEDTSSDGEYFCTGFKFMKLGPVLGTRTWGGYMAVAGPPVLDGGTVAFPVEGSFAPGEDKWLPDGTGFTPDILVPEDPAAFAAGRDNQLERAVAVLQDLIAKKPVYHPKRLSPPSQAKAFPPNKK